MRQLILTLLVALPLFAFAQSEQNRMDPKYLAGAFVEENGKLTLQRALDVNGLSEAQIREVVLDWTKQRFKGEKDKVYELDDNGSQIMVQAKDRIRVKIGLFGSYVDMFYNVLFSYSDNSCSFAMRGMRYTKNPFEQKPETIAYAEQYISDADALSKDGTKVSYGIGTYRMSTIDYADDLAKSAQEFFDIRYKNLVRDRVAQESETQYVAATAAAPATQTAAVAATSAVAADTVSEAVASTPDVAATTAAAATTVASATTAAAQPAATQKAEKKTIVSAEVAEYIKNGGAAVTKVGGKSLGVPVFGSSKYTKFGSTEIIMYKNAENKDNINLLLEMSQNFEITVYEVVGGKVTSKVAAVLPCSKAESMDDFIMGEIVK